MANLYETQELIETLYNKNQETNLIEKFIDSLSDIDNYLHGDEVKKRIFVNMLKLEDCLIETVIGMTTGNPAEFSMVMEKVIELGATGLLRLGVYPDKITVMSPIKLPANIKAVIRNYMFLPPLLVPPKKLVTNNDSGYLTIRKADVMLNGRNHKYNMNLAHLNRCNAVPYSLDERVIRTVADKAAHLDKPKDGETKEDYEKRVKAFQVFTKESMKVFATMINAGNKFYLTHNPDHRGRTYSRGYHINYQGNCYRKAIINLADKETLRTEAYGQHTPMDYLKIDIANNFGLDKKDYDVRLAWFEANKDRLHDLISEADEDALYVAGIYAYEDAMAGKPTGYMVSMDATSSGIQLLSVLTRCIRTAALCNVINVDGRRDAYKVLYEYLHTLCEERGLTLGDIDHPKVKKAIMTFFYGSRRKPKELLGDDSPQLEAFYNIMETECPGAFLAGEFLLNIWDGDALSYKFTLPDLFTVYAKVLAKKEHTIVAGNIEVVIPYTANEPVKKGREYPANVTHSVDAYVLREITARCDYDPDIIERARYALTNPAKECRQPNGIIKQFIEIFEKTNMVSLAIAEYLSDVNTYMLPTRMRKALIALIQDVQQYRPFHIATTHDCFRAHPNHMHRVTYWYNQLLGEILNGTLLQSIVDELTGGTMIAPVNQLDAKTHTEFLQAILDNEYSLT